MTTCSTPARQTGIPGRPLSRRRFGVATVLLDKAIAGCLADNLPEIRSLAAPKNAGVERCSPRIEEGGCDRIDGRAQLVGSIGSSACPRGPRSVPSVTVGGFYFIDVNGAIRHYEQIRKDLSKVSAIKRLKREEPNRPSYARPQCSRNSFPYPPPKASKWSGSREQGGAIEFDFQHPEY
jgi:hypothetical protein